MPREHRLGVVQEPGADALALAVRSKDEPPEFDHRSGLLQAHRSGQPTAVPDAERRDLGVDSQASRSANVCVSGGRLKSWCAAASVR